MTAVDDRRTAGHASMLAASRLLLSSQLEAADRDALTRACDDVRMVPAGTDMVPPRSPVDALHVLLEGWAARYKVIEYGGRYLPALLVPGDICDIDAIAFGRLEYGITALTECAVVSLPRSRAVALSQSHPNIGAAVRWLAFAENSILTEWATAMGRRSVHGRLAHLLCELLVRLKAVGRAEGNSFELPLTEEHLADALGSTVIQINRTLRLLCSNGLVAREGQRLAILNWSALCTFGGFRPDYLYFEDIHEQSGDDALWIKKSFH